MKNNKGFTLIELLTIIIVLGIIIVIAFPLLADTVKLNREKAYNKQVDFAESAAKQWSANNDYKISYNEDYYVSIAELIENGYIDQDELINPITNEPMTGCVKISYDNIYNSFEYKYGEYAECN
ncbi:MAG: prepilin-type N-terminal cleavage/methylation domain-containing protein [Bacilli bacterium]|nr:prepilin-type N-terminal cleavage/methylation domain-containing protein [Bacilli bacterium]